MPEFNRELAANVIIEAAYFGDDKACQKYGVSDRSLRRWRKRLATDNDLAAFVRLKKEAFDKEWAEELPVAMRAALRFITRAANEADSISMRNPEMIRSMAGALKICADVQMTGKVIDARLAGSNRADGEADKQAASGTDSTATAYRC